MSKTDRNEKRLPAERDLPMPISVVLEEHLPTSTRLGAVETRMVAKHYRSTALSGQAAEIPVYVTTKRDEQVAHGHYFADLTRFGEGVCQQCGARGWSAFWVAEGVFGEGTGEWIAAEIGRMDELVAISLVTDHLGGKVIALEPALSDEKREAGLRRLLHAVLDLDEPAAQTRRPGIPVPPMRRDHLTPVD